MTSVYSFDFVGSCVDGVNNYSCSCYPGFKGRTCEIDINECDFGFCQNNASCEDRVNDYQCNCTKGNEELNLSKRLLYLT